MNISNLFILVPILETILMILKSFLITLYWIFLFFFILCSTNQLFRQNFFPNLFSEHLTSWAERLILFVTLESCTLSPTPAKMWGKRRNPTCLRFSSVLAFLLTAYIAHFQSFDPYGSKSSRPTLYTAQYEIQTLYPMTIQILQISLNLIVSFPLYEPKK